MQLKTAIDKRHCVRSEANKVRQGQKTITAGLPTPCTRGDLKKLLLIMKLTSFLLLAACLTASAGGYTQTVTISVKNAPLEKVFKQIKKQTGYEFLYTDELLQSTKPVSIEVRNGVLSSVLDQCFAGQPVTYTIIDKTIVVKKKSPNNNVTLSGVEGLTKSDIPPPIDIHGRILDENGKPVIASVQVKGTNIGTTTNDNGEFELKGVEDNATLVISGVSIESFEVKVNGRSEFVLNAKVRVESLNEVVINKGYYTEKQKYSVGNVGKVTAKDIEKQPVNNPLLALEGRVPGLLISQSNGLQGGGVTVRIQGQNSITKGNDPLYVIDGVPYTSQLLTTGSFALVLGNSGSPNTNVYGNPLSFINPASIESIEVLKDADATAIYGSRAANGAILITTKRGHAGKIKLDVSFQTGIGKMRRRVDLLNTQQYLEMRREAKKNDNASIFSFDYDINGTWDTTRNTDWQKKLLGNTATYNDAQMNLSGGSGTTNYLVGVGYHKETDVFPGNFSDQKLSANFNLNSTSVNQKFRMGLSGSYLFDDNNLPTTDLTSVAIRLPPNAPNLLNADGTLNWAPDASGNTTWISGHPLSYLANTYNIKATNLISNLNLNYQVFRDLELKANLGYNNLQNDEMYLGRLSGYAPEQRQFFIRTGNYVNNKVNTWIAEPQINYNRNLGKSKVELLAGLTFQETVSDNQVLRGQGFISDELLKDIKAAPSISAPVSSVSYYKYNAVFGRINYNFNDKYIINLTGRRDGSSRFGRANQFHNFGSGGIGWIFSEENFLKKNFSVLSFGKIRGSYGTSGNDQIGDYEFMTLYSALAPAPQIPYQNVPGIRPNRLTNELLQWEETKKLQAGLDLGFLNDGILFSVNYFRNRSSNQLLNYALPITTGFLGITTNFPATVQNTGWEFSLNTNLKRKQFIWDLNFNLTIPKNKLVEFPNLKNSTYSTVLVVGQPVSVIQAYRFAGIDPSNGAPQFFTSSGNKTGFPTSNVDQTVFINTLPTYYGGFGNTLSYKGLQLDFLFQFVKQLGNNWHFGSFLPGGLYANQPTSVLNRWQKPGDQTDMQRFNSDFSLAFLHPNSNLIDAAYTDASFIRLKNLSLSWLLPESLQKRIGFANLSVFVRGQNLLTITKYEGLDPETRANGTFAALPPLTVYTFGIKAGL